MTNSKNQEIEQNTSKSSTAITSKANALSVILHEAIKVDLLIRKIARILTRLNLARVVNDRKVKSSANGHVKT